MNSLGMCICWPILWMLAATELLFHAAQGLLLLLASHRVVAGWGGDVEKEVEGWWCLGWCFDKKADEQPQLLSCHFSNTRVYSSL